MKLLLVEDTVKIASFIDKGMREAGFEVEVCYDAETGLECGLKNRYDAAIIDIMLPGMDGLQVCRQLRSNQRTEQIRILMLTARAEETDEIVGFNMGADDYVTKPFKVRPLIHRIKALLRRNDAATDRKDHLSIHGIEINRQQYSATCDGRTLDLTPTEFRLLWTLASQPGRPFSRNELMDTSRGEDANALERTIDVHVRSLRKKLNASAELIETVRGVGYRFLRK